MSLRAEKLSKLFQKGIGEIISTELNDPNVGFVTVTNVKVSSDLGTVTAYVSVFGDDPAKNKTIAGLNRAKGFIRRKMAKRVIIKFMPEIEFELDTSTEQIGRTLKLMKTLENGKEGEKQ